ncbi:MAG: Ig-like domain-containing protein [Thermoanaerobaculia bacterium]
MRDLRRSRFTRLLALGLASLPVAAAFALATAGGAYTLIGWNNLGMHCMDADFGVFSILPPFNTIHAQLVDPQGHLVTDPGGIGVTYEAVADAAGSINTTSVGKTNFWEHIQDFFGVTLPPDAGLAGHDLPGAGNPPQAMAFDPASSWFVADGIPITPIDDAQGRNPYPMMRLVARNAQGTLLAQTRIVLPVSDEMDCRACHASGSAPAARPAGGWVNDPDPQRDYRLNILRLHDEQQAGDATWIAALATAGYHPSGLEATVNVNGRAILCATCHASNALPGTGVAGVQPLTRAVHAFHATVLDPSTGIELGSSALRAACYRCHPGSTTRCLRGAMGKSVAADGTLAMQCQNCHGNMARVGAATRNGWLEEPACQSCHTGTATHNNGQVRYTSVFDEFGDERVAVDSTYATNPDAPAAGLDLYRFSYGHGGVACEACHGSTHAEFPTSHANDNVQSQNLQGHVGVLAECAACHASVPAELGGPHGLHPIGASWVADHADVAEQVGVAACRNCHGADDRGTPLSASQTTWTAATELGSKNFWRGFRIGCYACHLGPDNENRNPNRPAQAANAKVAALGGIPLVVPLAASDADGNPLTLRIVDQPAHGTVGLAGSTAILYPDSGYVGADRFTFAAWDGSIDSNLATISASVAGGGLFGDGFETGNAARWSTTAP